MNEFNQTLQKALYKRGVTQKEIAKYIQKTPYMIQYWRKNNSEPNYAIRRKISLYLNYPFPKTPIDPVNFGEQIQIIRERLKLTRKQLAESINVHEMTIYKWETNQSLPNEKSIIKLCTKYKISAQNLILYKKVTI